RLHVDVAALTEVRAEDADQLRLLAAVRVVAGEALARRDRSVHEFVVLLHHLMTHRAFLVVELVSVARLRHVTALALGRLRMNDRMLHHVAVTLHTRASRGRRRRRARSFTWSPVPPSSRSGAAPTAPPSARRER